MIARLEGEKSGLMASIKNAAVSGVSAQTMEHKAQMQALELTYKDEAIARLNTDIAELKTALAVKEERIENLNSDLVKLASRPSVSSFSGNSSEQQSLAVVPSDRRRLQPPDSTAGSMKKKVRLSHSSTEAAGFSDPFSGALDLSIDEEGSEEQLMFDQSSASSSSMPMMFHQPPSDAMAMFQFWQQQQLMQSPQGRGRQLVTTAGRGRGRPRASSGKFGNFQFSQQ